MLGAMALGNAQHKYYWAAGKSLGQRLAQLARRVAVMRAIEHDRWVTREELHAPRPLRGRQPGGDCRVGDRQAGIAQQQRRPSRKPGVLALKHALERCSGRAAIALVRIEN